MIKEHDIEWNRETVGRLWNWYSRTSPYKDLYFAKRFGDKILKTSGLPLNQPLRVLDFGCGPGHLWHHLVRMSAAWTYVGLDSSSDSVAQLRAEAGSDPDFGGAYCIDELPCDQGTASFDAAFLVEVVEHLDDQHLDPVLNELARLIRAGGHLVVSTPNREDLDASTKLCPECGAIFHEWQHVRVWDEAVLTRHVGRFGFSPVRVGTYDFLANGPHGALAHSLARMLSGKPRPHLLGVYRRGTVPEAKP